MLRVSSISRNVFANYLGVFGQILIAFLLTPYLVGTLGDEKYGVWSIAMSVAGFLMMLDFGIGSAVNRYVSRNVATGDLDSARRMISTAFVVFSVIAAFILAISTASSSLVASHVSLSDLSSEILYVLLIIISVDAAVFVFCGTFRGTLVGLQRYDILNLVSLTASGIKATLFYLALQYGFGLHAMAAIAVFTNTLIGLVFYLYLRANETFFRIEPRSATRGDAKSILSYSGLTFLGMVSNQIVFYSDSLIIGVILGSALVTIYAIPWSLIEYSKRMCLSISRTYAPVFSSLEAKGDMDGIYALYIDGTKVMMIVTHLLGIGMLILGDTFIAIWIGPEYGEKCRLILLILLCPFLASGPQMISYSLLQGVSRHGAYAFVSILMAGANLVLSIVLAQRLGIVGVALGAAVTQVAFHLFFVPVYVHRILEKPISRYLQETYLKSVIPTVLLGVFLLTLKENISPDSFLSLLSVASTSAIAYLLLCYLLILDPSQQAWCKERLGRLLNRR